MKLYLAALYSEMLTVRKHAEVLEAHGHIVTARWLRGAEENKTREVGALMDVHDVLVSDAVVLFTLPLKTLYSGGGRHVEFGLGIAWEKKLFVVGEREQIFCHLPQVVMCADLIELLGALDAHR